MREGVRAARRHARAQAFARGGRRGGQRRLELRPQLGVRRKQPVRHAAVAAEEVVVLERAAAVTVQAQCVQWPQLLHQGHRLLRHACVVGGRHVRPGVGEHRARRALAQHEVRAVGGLCPGRHHVRHRDRRVLLDEARVSGLECHSLFRALLEDKLGAQRPRGAVAHVVEEFDVALVGAMSRLVGSPAAG